MALFRRKKQQDSVLPDEVNQYYQAQRRERTGVAFVLGILALIATLLVGIGVFFGGRYLYQAIRGDDTPTPVVQTDNNVNQVPEIAGGSGGDSSNVAGGDDSAGNDASSNTSADDQSTATDETPALGDDLPNTGDEPAALPATGDEGH